jgi:inorganic pyrophosphatase/exopolyphosphatase
VCGAIAAAHLFDGRAALSEPAASLNGEILFALSEAADMLVRVQGKRNLSKEQALRELTPAWLDDLVADSGEERAEQMKVCLVDHSEKKQMAPWVRDRYHKQVVGLIDHHALAGSFFTEKPIFMDIRPWGCVCSILAHSFVRLHKPIPEHVAVLMLSAVLSDTLNLKSPTTTEADKFAVCLLSGVIAEAQRAQQLSMPDCSANASSAFLTVDTDALAARQFKAKTEWACGLGARAMARADCKEFDVLCAKDTTVRMVISVLEIAGTPAPVLAYRQGLVQEMDAVKREKGAALGFFFVVDVVTQTSVLVCPGAEEEAVFYRAFATDALASAYHCEDSATDSNTKSSPEVKNVGKFASRKKEFFPMLQAGVQAHRAAGSSA